MLDKNALAYINNWKILVESLADLKEQEISMRKIIAANLFKDLSEGSKTIDLGDGFKLNCVKKYNMTLDEASLSLIIDTLEAEGVNVSRLIKHKPEVVKSEYNKLNEEQCGIFSRCLIIKEALPSLKIK